MNPFKIVDNCYETYGEAKGYEKMGSKKGLNNKEMGYHLMMGK